jgi:hypothetical protein
MKTKCEADKLNERQLHEIEHEIETSKSKLKDLDNRMATLDAKLQDLKYEKVNENADVFCDSFNVLVLYSCSTKMKITIKGRTRDRRSRNILCDLWPFVQRKACAQAYGKVFHQV